MGITYCDTYAIGQRVNYLIKSNNKKVERVAIDIDLSPGHFRKLLNGKYRWKEEHIVNLSRELNVSVDYLVHGDEVPVDSVDEVKDKIRIAFKSMEGMDQKLQKECLRFILENATELLRE